MKYKLFWLLLLSIISSQPIQAQEFTQTIRGKVVDAQSKYPLAGANIVLIDSEPMQGTTTDAEGNFRLAQVKVGRQNIQASYLGYKTAVLSNLILISSRELVLEIELQEQVITGKEIKILANILISMANS